jgi:hypothetical protein
VLATIGGISAGFDAYSGFLTNSIKHQSTPLTNHMGLRTLVSYDPRYTAKHMRSHEVDPYAGWKEKRRSLLDDRSLLFAALILGGLALVGAYGRDRPDWETVAISTLLLFGIFELTSYYFSYLVILAPLCARRARYAAAFIAMAIATQLSSLSIVNFDEIFLLDSAIILALLLFVIGSELQQGPRLSPGKPRKAA